MCAALLVDVPRDDAERTRVGEIMARALQFPLDRVPVYFDGIGKQNLRVARVDGQIAAGLAFIRMGQFFGGRSVPMVGVGAVGVAPEFRAAGVGGGLMRSAVEELHAEGVALSTLYPATQPVYGRQGYETAGVTFDISLPTAGIRVRERDLPLRRAEPGDAEAIRALYRRCAASANGMLDRNEFMWQRVVKYRGEPADCYVITRDGQIDGYVYMLQRSGNPFPHNLFLVDHAFASPQAGRRLLALLADHRSMCDTASWISGPTDPLQALLDEQIDDCKAWTYWMVRITHLEAALTARGYNPHVRAELHLDVRDEILPAQAGRFVLSVADGRGRLERGGRGSLRLDIRGLAPLYTSHFSPEQALAAGLIEGLPADLEAARAIFAGPLPMMRDPF